MYPLEASLDLFLDLHLDIPSVVVLVHVVMVIHTIHMYVSISHTLSTPLTQYVHGVCIHSGGTCGDPVYLG